MKSILAVAFIAGFVAAEVPSNSYLPPPPHRGYSSGPAVVTARALERGHQLGEHNGDQPAPNGFARSGQQGHDAGHDSQSRYNDEQGYDQSSAGYSRNGLDDVNTTVSYEADDRGFKPQTYEDSEDLARSSPGYDTNANNFRTNNGYQGNEQNGGRSTARPNGYN